MTKIVLKIFSILLILTTALALSNCSKDNPVNVLPEDVAGTYEFLRYSFVPNASAVQSVNLLDTLVTQNTYVRLTDGGQFIINYQFLGGPQTFINGDFTLNQSRIVFQAAPGNEARLTSLLLTSPLRFDRNLSDNTLESFTERTADLAAFSDRYQGVPPVEGRLEIILQLMDE